MGDRRIPDLIEIVFGPFFKAIGALYYRDQIQQMEQDDVCGTVYV